jgi:uncharacterized protein YkwD
VPRLRSLAAVATAGAALAAAAPASAHAACTGADVMPTPSTLHEARHATLCLLNVVRREHGLHTLRSSRRLRHAATAYSFQMVAHGFFAHVSPVSGSTLVSRNRAYVRHAGSWSLGENIAWGSGSYATPRDTVSAWMHSPPHRHNILTGSFREIGVGIAPGAPVGAAAGQAAATYTTDFGRRG